MSRLRPVLPVLLAAVALLPASALALLQVGQQAPDFSLPDTAGVYHSLSEYSGKVVLLNFWTST
ncbi:MAG: redoxin domain-containing protein [bacterium]